MTSRKISLDGTHKQIIDLNEDMVNFVVEFTITPQQSDMEKPYEIAITTQEKLDAGVEAKFTQISGVFNKTIKNTTGTYQNYCLMMSSKTEIKDITITIKLSEIAVEQPLVQPPAPHAPVQQVSQASHAGLLQAQEVPLPTPTHEHSTNNDTGKKFKIIVGVLVVIIGGCALYYFWNKSKKGAVSLTTEVPSVDTTNPLVSPTAVPTLLKQTPSTTFSFY